jgi:hypothetical protein
MTKRLRTDEGLSIAVYPREKNMFFIGIQGTSQWYMVNKQDLKAELEKLKQYRDKDHWFHIKR